MSTFLLKKYASAGRTVFEKGLNIMQVAAITGHKDLKMLKRYTLLRAEDLAQMLG